MSTPLVVSVTDELVAELEALAKKSDAAGEDWVSYADLAGTLANQCDIDYIVDASPATILALLAERAELLRDAKRYRWLCNGNGYFMEENMICHVSNDKAEADAAIDAAMQSEAEQ